MKTIEFLKKILYEGWSNEMVSVTNEPNGYGSIEDFAISYVGCMPNVRIQKQDCVFDNSKPYGIIWAKDYIAEWNEDFFAKADYVGGYGDNENEKVYFFQLD